MSGGNRLPAYVAAVTRFHVLLKNEVRVELRSIQKSGEVAELLGVSVGWLRIGERLGFLLFARRSQSGWRYYISEDLDWLRCLGVGERKRRLEGGDE